MSGNRGKGRPKGSLNRRTLEAADAAAELGVNPLRILLHLAGEAHADWLRWQEEEAKEPDPELKLAHRAMAQAAAARAADFASKAAPYLHPKMQVNEAQVTINHDDWVAQMEVGANVTHEHFG